MSCGCGKSKMKGKLLMKKEHGGSFVVKGHGHDQANKLSGYTKHGVPVVDSNGNQHAEVESGELVVRKNIVARAEKGVSTRKGLQQLGLLIKKELKNNTKW